MLSIGTRVGDCISAPHMKTIEYSGVQVQVPAFLNSQVFTNRSLGSTFELSGKVTSWTNWAMLVHAEVASGFLTSGFGVFAFSPAPDRSGPRSKAASSPRA